MLEQRPSTRNRCSERPSPGAAVSSLPPAFMSGKSVPMESSPGAIFASLEPFAFAGLWEFTRIDSKELLSAAIIVGEANPLVAQVHDRMPVMLMPEDYDRWLDPVRRS